MELWRKYERILYMPQVKPEEMGVEEQVVFGMPLDDGSEILFSLEKSYAERLYARAAASKMPVGNFLARLLEREMNDPKSPWNLIYANGL